MNEEYLFVIVLYKQSLSASDSYHTMSKALIRSGHTASLVVVDNSPQIMPIPEINEAWKDVLFFHNVNNTGLSAAYNTGAQIAIEKSISWMVLLDQDTLFSEDFMVCLDNAISQYPREYLFAPLLFQHDGSRFSPTRYKHKRGYQADIAVGVHPLAKYSPVNSGMVINVDAFHKAGGYDEDVFLDFADFQFIERFRKYHSTFVLFQGTGIQDFSANERDRAKLESRFRLYLQCALNCTRNSYKDRLLYMYAVFRHTVGLVIKGRSFKFFVIFFNNYLFVCSKR